MASTLATFNITKAVDAEGNPINPSGEYTNGLLRYVASAYRSIFFDSMFKGFSSCRYPKPFPCRISPRSEVASALVQSDVDV